MVRKPLFLLAFFAGLQVLLWSDAFRPWFGKDLIVDKTLRYSWRHTARIDQGGEREKYRVNDHLLHADFSLSPEPQYNIDGGACLAYSSREDFLFDSAHLMFRRKWYDDIVGDPLSVTTGLSAHFVSSKSVRSPSMEHAGELEGELHLALGKEHTVRDSWDSRWWFAFALGGANRGRPWWRSELAWEKHWEKRHLVRLLLSSRWGFGTQELNLSSAFRGYGSLKQRSVDASLRYSLNTSVWNRFSVDLCSRLYARNAPARVYQFSAGYTFPLPW